MLYRTHLLFSILVFLLLRYFTGIKAGLLFFVLLVSSSFIPDLDHPNSKIGQKFKILSKTLNKIFKHRGFLHSIILPFLIYFIFAYIFELKEVGFAVAAGIISHLFLDLLTKDGLSLLSPFSDKKIKGFISVGKISEKIFFIFLLILFIIFLIKISGL